MKTFIESIKIIAVALIIGWGVSAVSADWNPPTRAVGTGTVTAPTSDNAKAVNAGINIGSFDQIKKGGIIINPQLAYPESKGLFVSPLSFFKKTLLPGADTSLYIGGASFDDPSFSLSQYPDDRSVPVTVNLTGRTDVTGAIKFKTNELCPVSTKLINTNSPAFEFWTSKSDGNSDLLAKGIKLDGGSPGPGKILISVDNKGRAVWATPKLDTDGKTIIFDTHDDSPVGVCQPSGPTYHWTVFWSRCRQVYDGGFTTNIDPGQQVEYGTVICRDASNHVAPDTDCSSLGAPWPDMDGVSPIRNASNSLPLCPTGSGSGSGSLKMWRCHATNIGNGSWIAYPGPSIQDTCTTQSAPASNPATEGQLSCYDGIPPYICAGG